jgi:hypothetical protein
MLDPSPCGLKCTVNIVIYYQIFMSYQVNIIIFQIIWLQRCIVLDIEGTTTPITFVADVLFPYARDNVGRHLSATYDTAETKDDINLLRTQVRFIIRSFGMLVIHMSYQIDFAFYCRLPVEF